MTMSVWMLEKSDAQHPPAPPQHFTALPFLFALMSKSQFEASRNDKGTIWNDFGTPIGYIHYLALAGA
jgi:hypothetical protein